MIKVENMVVTLEGNILHVGTELTMAMCTYAKMAKKQGATDEEVDKLIQILFKGVKASWKEVLKDPSQEVFQIDPELDVEAFREFLEGLS